MDSDNDGKISFEDFRDAFEKKIETTSRTDNNQNPTKTQ